MKKYTIVVILVELLLLFNLSLNIFWLSKFIEGLIVSYQIYQIDTIWSYSHYITWIILYSLAALTTIAAMVLVAILNLPAFQPLRDKLTARRTARAEQKAERDKAAKQERIKALESELEELKKD